MATTTTWPSSLMHCKLLTRDLQQSLPDLATRTQMEVGPAHVRGRLTANVEPLSGSVVMTHAEVGTLRTFFVTTLKGGAEAFLWIDPRTGEQVEFRFVEPPHFSPLAPRMGGRGLVSVSLSLEILPASSTEDDPAIDQSLVQLDQLGSPGDGWPNFGSDNSPDFVIGVHDLPFADIAPDPDLVLACIGQGGMDPDFGEVDSVPIPGTMAQSTLGPAPFAF